MNCPNWERRLALYAEGDLSGREAQETEKHLRQCTGCREFTEGLKESQAAVRSLGEEEVAAIALASVRQRVLAEVGGRKPSRRFAFRWWHAVPAGVAAMVMALLLWPRIPAVEPPPVLAIAPPPAPEVLRPVPLPETPQVVETARRPRVPDTKPGAESEPLLVKFFTDDPDVVIYWIIDQKEGKS